MARGNSSARGSRAERERVAIESYDLGFSLQTFANIPPSVTVADAGKTKVGSRAELLKDIDSTKRSGRSKLRGLLENDFNKDPLIKGTSVSTASILPDPDDDIGVISIEARVDDQAEAEKVFDRIKTIVDSYRVVRGGRQSSFLAEINVRGSDGRQLKGRRD